MNTNEYKRAVIYDCQCNDHRRKVERFMTTRIDRKDEPFLGPIDTFTYDGLLLPMN